MKKLTCLIVDHELSSLELLEEYINDTSFFKLIGKCSNALEAIEIMNDHQIDLLFLDIHLPDLNNKDFSRMLKNGPRIILTTTLKEYAFIGFRANALDCLLKPINYETFLKVSYKAKGWFQSAAKL